MKVPISRLVIVVSVFAFSGAGCPDSKGLYLIPARVSSADAAETLGVVGKANGVRLSMFNSRIGIARNYKVVSVNEITKELSISKEDAEASLRVGLEAQKQDMVKLLQQCSGDLAFDYVAGETSISSRGVSITEMILPIFEDGAFCSLASLCCNGGKAVGDLPDVCGPDVVRAIYKTKAEFSVRLKSARKMGLVAQGKCSAAGAAASLKFSQSEEKIESVSIESSGWNYVATIPIDQACRLAERIPACQGWDRQWLPERLVAQSETRCFIEPPGNSAVAGRLNDCGDSGVYDQNDPRIFDCGFFRTPERHSSDLRTTQDVSRGRAVSGVACGSGPPAHPLPATADGDMSLVPSSVGPFEEKLDVLMKVNVLAGSREGGQDLGARVKVEGAAELEFVGRAGAVLDVDIRNPKAEHLNGGHLEPTWKKIDQSVPLDVYVIAPDGTQTPAAASVLLSAGKWRLRVVAKAMNFASFRGVVDRKTFSGTLHVRYTPPGQMPSSR